MDIIHYGHCKHCMKNCSASPKDHVYPCEDATCKEGNTKLPTKVVKSV